MHWNETWRVTSQQLAEGYPRSTNSGGCRGTEAIGHLMAPAKTSYTTAFGNGPLNFEPYGQVTWTTPELAPPLLTTTTHRREDVSALDRFSVHRCPTRRVFSGTGLELVTKPATIRYLYHSATAALSSPQSAT
ncbi:uncharacterized protein TNCV_4443581 [Trichonephila clavipes]|nr:uncharacterized protein TNCV_4443581 [Trichonephila clavipes]